MFNGNGRPLGTRKTVQLMLALTILAWATQTLLHQWGYAAPAPADAAERAGESDAAAGAADAGAAEAPARPEPSQEWFVPSAPRFAAGATLEFRGEATVYGPEIRLKQVCRWSGADAAVFSPVADLVLARFDAKAPFKTLTLRELRQTLHDAGVNLAVVRFAGTTSCTVARGDARYDEGAALEQWVSARQAAGAEGGPGSDADGVAGGADNGADAEGVRARAVEPEPRVVAVSGAEADVAAASPVRTLREALTEDLCTRLNLPIGQAQLSFDPRDDKVLNLSEPQFRFNLDAKRVRDLGKVAWDVTIVSDRGSRKVPVSALARAWQNQVVTTKPLAYRQVIRAGDVTERRTLADRLPDDALLAASQVVGQQAARDLKPGVIFTAKMVEAVPLAKTGQFITVTLNRGTVKVKTVGRAMEGGSYGQTIRVKNEATRDVYEVVLTGPQEAAMGPVAADAEPPSAAAAGADIASAREE